MPSSPPASLVADERPHAEEARLSRRDLRLWHTREALKQAALDLFSERGYDTTSVAEIAVAAGVSERTFFRHFRTKDDVLFHRSRDRFDLLDVALRAHVDVACPTWDGIRRALEQFASDIQRQDDRLDQLAHAVYEAPSLAARVREHRALWQEWAAATLGHERDATRAAFVAAVVLATLYRGQEIWVRSQGALDLGVAMSQAVDEARTALPAS